MKITSMALTNITSFRGKHYVDFSDIASQSDLFAITGPTGAGKSTLLNAMAMAIFSDNVKGLSAPDLVTMGEASGAITLCLEINGDQYRVEWSCQVLKKDGTPRAKPTSTSRLYKNEEQIEDRLENIINLDFKQFNQVIVLNQGKFSEFLTSTFSERKNILEGLLGHKELKDLGKKVRSQKTLLENEIKSLKDQSEQAQLLTPNDLKIIQEKLTGSISSQKELKEKQEIAKQLTGDLTEIVKLVLKERKNNEFIAKQLEKAKDIETDLDALTKDSVNQEKQLHKIKETFKKRKPLLEEARKNDSQRNLATNDLNSASIAIDETREDLKENGSFLEKREEEHQELANSIVAKEKDLLEYNNPSIQSLTKLREALLEIKEIDTQIGIHTQSIKQIEADKSAIETKGRNYQSQKELLLKKFNSEYKSISKEIIDDTFEDVTKNYQHYKDLTTKKNKLYCDFKDRELVCVSELKSVNDSKSNYERKYTELTKKRDQTLQSISELDKEKIILGLLNEKQAQELKQQDLLLKAKAILFNQHSHESGNEERDCPVCTTTKSTNQWIEQFNTLIPSDTEKNHREWEETANQLDKKKNEIHKNTASLKVEEKGLKELQEDLENLKIKSRDLKLEKESLAKKLTDLAFYNNESFQRKLELLNQMQSVFEEIQKERSLWSKNEEQLKKAKDLVSSLLSKRNNISESLKDENEGPVFNSLINATDGITSVNSALKDVHALEKMKEGTIRISVTIDKAKKDQRELRKKAIKLEEQIVQLNTILSKLENEKAKNHYPDNPLQEAEESENEIEELTKSLDRKRKDKNEKQNEFDKNLSQINLLKEQNTEIGNLKTVYLEKLDQGIQQLRKAHLTDEDQPLKKLIELTSQNLDGEIFRDNISLWSEFLNDHLAPFGDLIDKLVSEVISEISGYQTQIKQNELQNQKISALLEQRETLVEKLSELLNLEHYVGKDQFRDFTLAVLEQNLLKVANNEIESLADGRYKLIHAKAGKRSEFLVQDYWQGGLKRKVSTLSGGETFLLSLGLSLGLCEISRGQTEIDCFFIDEGFGTLDSECIEQVLNCLMALQSRGKQIGLISHVKSLTDQIPVRLELSKNNFGESSLTVQ